MVWAASSWADIVLLQVLLTILSLIVLNDRWAAVIHITEDSYQVCAQQPNYIRIMELSILPKGSAYLPESSLFAPFWVTSFKIMR